MDKEKIVLKRLKELADLIKKHGRKNMEEVFLKLTRESE